MGTNYYLRRDACQHCGRSDDERHIGKSSAGWCFSLHVIPEEGINNLDDWKREFARPNARIFNEYHEEITVADMLGIITDREWGNPAAHRRPSYLQANHATEGPNGLMRHQVDGVHCIGHGEGTWDLTIGEFS